MPLLLSTCGRIAAAGPRDYKASRVPQCQQVILWPGERRLRLCLGRTSRVRLPGPGGFAGPAGLVAAVAAPAMISSMACAWHTVQCSTAVRASPSLLSFQGLYAPSLCPEQLSHTPPFHKLMLAFVLATMCTACRSLCFTECSRSAPLLRRTQQRLTTSTYLSTIIGVYYVGTN